MRVDFSYQRSQSWLGRTVEVCLLLYHNTVREQRKSSRIPVVGLIKSILQTLVLVAVFYTLYVVIGIRSAPVRGDLILFLLTGILGYINHLKGFMSVVKAPGPTSQLMQHQPMTSFAAIVSSTLSALYIVALTTIIVLFFYDHFVAELHIYDVLNFSIAMGLSCISGAFVGLAFYGAQPFAPAPIAIMQQLYQRISMIASGKMFLANTIPPMMMPFFSWHPLFHINDQARGYAFNNYFPHKTNMAYPLTFMAVCFTIGLLLMFLAKRRASMSWGARQI